MNRLNNAQCYLDLTLFTEADLDRCNDIIENGKEQEEGAVRASGDTTSGSTEEFIDLIQSLANRCSITNKELEKELRQK